MTTDVSSAQPRVRPTRRGVRAQERGDRTRAAIVEETIRCVTDEGFAAASANHIAERAGVTWGVIQYHFGDRNGLLAAVVTFGFEQFRAALAAITVPDGPDRRRVAAVVDAAWGAFSSPPSMASLEILIATRSGRSEAQAAELTAMANEMRTLGRTLVGRAAPGRVDGEVIGEVLWAALRGLAFSQILSDRPLDIRAERDVLIGLITDVLVGHPIRSDPDGPA